MKILAIETSCDETAVSVVEAGGAQWSPFFKILASVVHSQVAIHAEWSGVVPSLAKREHAKNLTPVLQKALNEAALLKQRQITHPLIRANKRMVIKIKKTLAREFGLAEAFLDFVPSIETPKIDVIAVTRGPGLEPALWTGINFAKALSICWEKPIIPINHMEGHALSAILPKAETGEKIKANLKLPAIALLISGGHTELVLIKNWLEYKVIGHTRDDAIGEAFDKVARMLGLPYPGGPEISKLAEKFVKYHFHGKRDLKISLPRPMLNSGDLDFSFSGLKTAVLYLIKKLQGKDALVLEREEIKSAIAHEFEEAVVEVLINKTKRALENCSAREKIKTLIIGGGVIANKKIRLAFQNLVKKEFPKMKLLVPDMSLTTDNATMIALAAYFHWLDLKKKGGVSKKNFRPRPIKADGNLSLA